MNPIEAVTSPDPYQFYSELATQKPLNFDETLRMWIASSSDVVASILSDKRFSVRPPTEPIPPVLTGLQSGQVFGALMRMTDGPQQCRLKRSALQAINQDCIDRCRELTRDTMRELKEETAALPSLNIVHKAMFVVPSYVVGTLLGVPSTERP
jgi:cytochrome P450